MVPTKVRNSKVNRIRRNESKKGSSIRLGTLSPDPWDFTLLMPIPVDYFFVCWGSAQFETGPSLVLAPESALRLPPGRALSSAPSACSVCRASNFAQDGTKKDLIIAALSDMVDIRREYPSGQLSR